MSVLRLRLVALGVCVAFLGAVSGTAEAQTPNWLRAYIGAQGGYAWEDLDLTSVPSNQDVNDFLSQIEDFEGGIGGVQGGANFYQNGNIIAGIVADFMWLDASDSASITQTTTFGDCYESYECELSTLTASLDLNVDVDWKASIRTKTGFLLTPSVLAYTTGGIAFAKIDVEAMSTLTISPPPQSTTLSASDDAILIGIVTGGGIESFVTPDISTFFQVLYYNFEEETLNLAGSRLEVDLEETVVEAGVSFYLN